MFTSRAQRRISLLALFVLLWGLVFPALANAGVGSANAAWSEVCTAHGIKKIQQSSGESHPLGYHATAGHCVLCCLDGVLAAVEPISMLAGLDPDPQTAVLPELYAAPPEQFILLTAPPRAPPFPS